ncbi:Holliday junction branch migration protein RuvA [Candidatus Gracilibacteria bacterium]|nr:Holliday junction branch migration protein RuvA [Candidatus Gracilibacteria bacterium]
MIGYLHGTVLDVHPKSILILTQSGVGYEVLPAGSLLSRCKKDTEISAEICTIVRETEITLYGFGSRTEKDMFEKLIHVSGIGPKTALGMVSTPVDQLLSAIENGDIAFITRMPGIGKKTAERLIIELRGKLDLTAVPDKHSHQTPAMQEAVDALKNLGYDTKTIEDVLKHAPEEAATESLVKYFLTSNA